MNEGNNERQPAKPTWNVPPGFYDDCAYVGENEESFGLIDYLRELAEIRRIKVSATRGERKR